MNTAWLNELRHAMLRLKDLEERIEALENPTPDMSKMLPGQTGWGVLPSGESAPEFGPIVVKRKPGRPRKNA